MADASTATLIAALVVLAVFLVFGIGVQRATIRVMEEHVELLRRQRDAAEMEVQTMEMRGLLEL